MFQDNKTSKRRANGNARVRTFAERLDEGFGALSELRALLRKRNASNCVTGPNEAVADLVAALHGIVGNVEELLRANHSINNANEDLATISVSGIARAMLIAGSRYEPAVLQAMREYRTAFDNVRRYEGVSLPPDIKADVLARFGQQLDYCCQTLRVLDVEPFVPQVGTSLEPIRHRVVKVLPCPYPEHAETIAEVIAPGFGWSDDQVSRRIEPAEVFAYGPVTASTEKPEMSAVGTIQTPDTLCQLDKTFRSKQRRAEV